MTHEDMSARMSHRFPMKKSKAWVRILVGLLAGLLNGCAHSPMETSTAKKATPVNNHRVYQVAPFSADHQQVFDGALEASQQSAWPVAEQMLKTLAVARPDVAAVKAKIAWVIQRQGRQDEARRWYREALILDPSDTMTTNNLALILKESGEFQAARDLLLQGLEHHREVPELHYNLAVLSELYLLDLAAALKHYQAYQDAVQSEDGRVKGWIADLERRLR
ncbi:tetratricopeptide repeat protein [Marinobacter caseinilyticus]|uniref:tetratricopeptide repeat protein n=1 Tax=Marinobacter caseinilyticus TaxID=2692195 RepID=UPI0014081E26|nr:tetratricopeptide repeat protein [Marinobacter caseinilyticus]